MSVSALVCSVSSAGAVVIDIIGLGQVDIDRDAVFLAGVTDDVGEIVGRRRRAAPGFRGPVHQFQAIWHEAGLVHAVPRLLDQFGNVDAHRAGERAAPAEGASVEEQRLPFLPASRCRHWSQSQQPVERREGADMAMISLFERLELVDRRVFRIAGRDIDTGRRWRTCRSERRIPCGSRRSRRNRAQRPAWRRRGAPRSARSPCTS